MKWVCLATGFLLGLGCAGFAGEPTPTDEGAEPPIEGDLEQDDEPVDTAAVADTGGSGAPETPAAPGEHRRKAKKRGRRPPATRNPHEGLTPEPGPSKPAKRKPPTPKPKPAGIEQVDDTHWRVSTSLVAHWQDDPYQLAHAREKDPGWELLAVRVRDAYHLGMQNKDQVVTVNGHKLNTKAQLLGTYLACKNDKTFDVEFYRAGQLRVHHYTLVE